MHHTLNNLWAQILPLVALQIYKSSNEDAKNDTITLFLVGSFVSWLLLNVAFFLTINQQYLNTFYNTRTGPQFCVDSYETMTEDFQRFAIIFDNNLYYTKRVHEEVKIWVGSNIERWKVEGEDWFKIEKNPEEFLPAAVFAAAGGAQRRRSNVSVRELVGFEPVEPTNNEQQIISLPSSSVMVWETLAEDIYKTRTSNHKVNYAQLKRTLDNNEVLFALIISRCKPFRAILSYILAAGQIKLFDEVEGE